MSEPSTVVSRLSGLVKKRWRAWLRAFHRDVGYLAIGLTFVYAISGLALNHIGQWDPNFDSGSTEHQLEPLPADKAVATERVLDALGIDETPERVDLIADVEMQIFFEHRTLNVDLASGTVYDDYREPRFFLRVANWLHANRGKAAWTYIADAYAVLLLYLAISGMFMLKGRLGLKGRGGILIAAGVLVPILYLQLAGGPTEGDIDAESSPAASTPGSPGADGPQ